MSNLWGHNANGNALGDEGFFLHTLQEWKSPVLLMMNGLEGTNPNNIVVRASRLQEAHGGMTVYRPYENPIEGRPWVRAVSDHLAFLRRFQASWLWYNVGNEPKPNGEAEIRQMCKWYADLIRGAGDVRLVVFNPGVGTFERSHIQAGWYDELLITLTENMHKTVNVNGVLWPQFILGSHSTAYWHGIPSVHCAGRNPADLIRPESLKEVDWPTAAQIFDADTFDNWILFRDYWFIERARKLRPNAPDIQIIATEAGFENLPNIRLQFPDVVRKMDALCGRETRGMPTIGKYLEWAFPGQSAVEMICKCYRFVQERAPKMYRAFLTFSWTWHNAAPDFWKDNYNLGEQRPFLERWPKFLGEQTTTEPEQPMPLPDTSDTRWRETTNQSGANFYVRPEARIVEYPNLPKINAGELFSSIVTDDPDWLYGKSAAGNIGYVHKDVLKIAAPPPPPPVEDDPPPDLSIIFRQHREAWQMLIDNAKRDLEPLLVEQHALSNKIQKLRTQIGMFEQWKADYDTIESAIDNAA